MCAHSRFKIAALFHNESYVRYGVCIVCSDTYKGRVLTAYRPKGASIKSEIPQTTEIVV